MLAMNFWMWHLKHKQQNKKLTSKTISCCCLVIQSCGIFCHPTDCSPPGFSIHGISQARILEWIAIFFSGDLPNPGTKSTSSASPALQTVSLPLSHWGSPSKTISNSKAVHSKRNHQWSQKTNYQVGNLNFNSFLPRTVDTYLGTTHVQYKMHFLAWMLRWRVFAPLKLEMTQQKVKRSYQTFW